MSSSPPAETLPVSIAVKKFIWDDFYDELSIDGGTFADVYIFRSRDYGTVAVKKFRQYQTVEEKKRDLEVEVLLKHSKHPNIVHVFGFLGDENNRNLGYVMENMRIGTLCKVIHDQTTHYDWRRMVSWVIKILRGLNYLHNEGIMHRDIKPKNILLGRNLDDLKISDFGTARAEDQRGSNTFGHGTAYYMAPEFMNSKNYNGYKVDVYAFTITFWEIIHRKKPYNSTSQYTVMMHVLKDELRPVLDADLFGKPLHPPQFVAPILERGWHQDPNKRPSISQLLDIAAGWAKQISGQNEEPESSNVILRQEDAVVVRVTDYDSDAQIEDTAPLSFSPSFLPENYEIPDDLDAISVKSSDSSLTVVPDVTSDSPVAYHQHDLKQLDKIRRETDDSGFGDNLSAQSPTSECGDANDYNARSREETSSLCSTQNSFDLNDEHSSCELDEDPEKASISPQMSEEVSTEQAGFPENDQSLEIDSLQCFGNALDQPTGVTEQETHDPFATAIPVFGNLSGKALQSEPNLAYQAILQMLYILAKNMFMDTVKVAAPALLITEGSSPRIVKRDGEGLRLNTAEKFSGNFAEIPAKHGTLDLSTVNVPKMARIFPSGTHADLLLKNVSNFDLFVYSFNGLWIEDRLQLPTMNLIHLELLMKNGRRTFELDFMKRCAIQSCSDLRNKLTIDAALKIRNTYKKLCDFKTNCRKPRYHTNGNRLTDREETNEPESINSYDSQVIQADNNSNVPASEREGTRRATRNLTMLRRRKFCITVIPETVLNGGHLVMQEVDSGHASPEPPLENPSHRDADANESSLTTADYPDSGNVSPEPSFYKEDSNESSSWKVDEEQNAEEMAFHEESHASAETAEAIEDRPETNDSAETSSYGIETLEFASVLDDSMRGGLEAVDYQEKFVDIQLLIDEVIETVCSGVVSTKVNLSTEGETKRAIRVDGYTQTCPVQAEIPEGSIISMLNQLDLENFTLEPPIAEERSSDTVPDISIEETCPTSTEAGPSTEPICDKVYLEQVVALTAASIPDSIKWENGPCKSIKTKSLDYLLIFTRWSNSDYIFFFNRLKNRRKSFPLKTPFKVEGYAIEFLNDEVYLFGGKTSSGNAVKSTYKLNSSLQWKRSEDMLHRRSNFASVTFDGQIWTFGGLNKNAQLLNQVEKFDSMNKKWKEAKPMKYARANSAVTVINHKIFVCGGIAQQGQELNIQESIEVLDPKSECWTTFYQPMPPTNGDFYAHSAGSHLYVTSHNREELKFWKIDVTKPSREWEETYADKKKEIFFIARTGETRNKVYGNVFLPHTWANEIGLENSVGIKSVELQSGSLLDAIKANWWLSDVSKPFSTSRVMLLGGKVNREDSASVYLLDKECTSWRKLPFSLPSKMSYHGAVCVENKIYAFGGADGQATGELYCLNGKKWERKCSLLEKRRGISNTSGVFQNNIYVIGGEDEKGNALNSVEIYDSKNPGNWSYMPELKIPRTQAAATVVKGKIVVCGGKATDGVILSSVEIYDPTCKSWGLIRSIPSPRCSLSLSSFGSTVIAMGGEKTSASAEVWALDTRRSKNGWKVINNLKEPRRNGCAVKFGNFKIIAAGGQGTKSTEIFDGHNWKKGPQLPEELHGMAAVAISEDLANVLSTLIIYPKS